MTTASDSDPRGRGGSPGERVELARYRVAAGERVVYGQRVDGVVRVTDRPAITGGRAYLIERGLHTQGELDALVKDYIAQAAVLDTVPAGHNPLDRYLDAIDAR